MSAVRAGQRPESPPAAFPVYGLDRSWPGARWLDQFGDAIGDPPRWVALAHEAADGESLIMVNTYARPATDAQAARTGAGESPLASVAFDAAGILVNLTLPPPSVPRPDGFLPRLVAHAADLAGQHWQWAAGRWRLGAASVPFRSCRFAGGWTAISDAVDDVYLALVGVSDDVDGGPEGLSLGPAGDGRAYHIDLAAPLQPRTLTASRRAAGPTLDEPQWQRRDWHADQLRLMSAQR
jgi:hypothetical protein